MILDDENCISWGELAYKLSSMSVLEVRSEDVLMLSGGESAQRTLYQPLTAPLKTSRRQHGIDVLNLE